MSERRISIVALVIGIVALGLSWSLVVLLYLDFPLFPFQERIAEQEKQLVQIREDIAKQEEELAQVYDKLFPRFKKVLYKITPNKVYIPESVGDEWGKPEAYIRVYHNRSGEIIRTYPVKNRYALAQEELASFSKEIVFKISEHEYASDYILVQLWEADTASEDDLIASWYVRDPMKLENLSPQNGAYVKFAVEKEKVIGEGRER